MLKEKATVDDFAALGLKFVAAMSESLGVEVEPLLTSLGTAWGAVQKGFAATQAQIVAAYNEAGAPYGEGDGEALAWWWERSQIQFHEKAAAALREKHASHDEARRARETEQATEQATLEARVLTYLTDHMTREYEAWEIMGASGRPLSRIRIALDALIESGWVSSRGGHPRPHYRATPEGYTEQQRRTADADADADAYAASVDTIALQVLGRLAEQYPNQATRSWLARALHHDLQHTQVALTALIAAGYVECIDTAGDAYRFVATGQGLEYARAHAANADS